MILRTLSADREVLRIFDSMLVSTYRCTRIVYCDGDIDDIWNVQRCTASNLERRTTRNMQG